MAFGTLKSEAPPCLDEGVARTSEATPGTIGFGPGAWKCLQTIPVAQVAHQTGGRAKCLSTPSSGPSGHHHPRCGRRTAWQSAH
jgi:hypothetical protein